jgi:hypothetical protein
LSLFGRNKLFIEFEKKRKKEKKLSIYCFIKLQNLKIMSFECPKSIRNYEKILGMSDASPG